MAKKKAKKYSGRKLEAFCMEVDGLEISVERKLIKYIHLKIDQSSGQVRLSVPEQVGEEEIRRLIRSRKEWIRTNQEQIREKHPEHSLQYEDGDVYPLWGIPLRLEVRESPAYSIMTLNLKKKDDFPYPSEVSGMENAGSPGRTSFSMSVNYIPGWEEKHRAGQEHVLCMELPPGTSAEQRQKLMEEFYRFQMKRRIPEMAARCEARTGLYAKEWKTRKMKTRWGSCNWKVKRIWLNLQLASMDQECLEYVMIHELCHLLEPSHNARFYGLMDQFLPGWKEIRRKMR